MLDSFWSAVKIENNTRNKEIIVSSIKKKVISNIVVGHIGLVDYDVVELGNLHRQILHTESRVEQQKSASVAQSCNQ